MSEFAFTIASRAGGLTTRTAPLGVLPVAVRCL
jgi:hypothetical protein